MLSVATEMRSILCLSLPLFSSSSGTLTPSPSHPCNLTLFPSADSGHPRSHSPPLSFSLPDYSASSSFASFSALSLSLSLSLCLHPHPLTGAFVGSDGLKTRRITALSDHSDFSRVFYVYRPFVNLVPIFVQFLALCWFSVKILSCTRCCLDSDHFHN